MSSQARVETMDRTIKKGKWHHFFYKREKESDITSLPGLKFHLTIATKCFTSKVFLKSHIFCLCKYKHIYKDIHEWCLHIYECMCVLFFTEGHENKKNHLIKIWSRNSFFSLTRNKRLIQKSDLKFSVPSAWGQQLTL